MNKNIGTLQDKNGNSLFPVGIETISNDNGKALKFPDGTMICVGTNTGVDASSRLVTFPVKFEEVYSIVATCYGLSTSFQLTAQIGEINNTDFKVMVHYSDTQAGSNKFYWQAIGRWK